jgi:hypothetical protein
MVEKSFHNMYTSGRIKESSFDRENVEVDRDSARMIVSRHFGISKENCQRAKVLSAKTQRLERVELVKNMRRIKHNRRIDLFDYETKRYALNKQCKDNLLVTHSKLQCIRRGQQNIKTEEDATPNLTFASILADLTEEHFGKDKCEGKARGRPTRPQLSAFVQVRQPILKFRGRFPQYKKTHSDRARMVQECIRVSNLPPLKRIFTHPGEFEED